MSPNVERPQVHRYACLFKHLYYHQRVTVKAGPRALCNALHWQHQLNVVGSIPRGCCFYSHL